jgi:hypothetical protein
MFKRFISKPPGAAHEAYVFAGMGVFPCATIWLAGKVDTPNCETLGEHMLQSATLTAVCVVPGAIIAAVWPLFIAKGIYNIANHNKLTPTKPP